eukprot:5096291-Amphidinium_carterae.1
MLQYYVARVIRQDSRFLYAPPVGDEVQSAPIKRGYAGRRNVENTAVDNQTSAGLALDDTAFSAETEGFDRICKNVEIWRARGKEPLGRASSELCRHSTSIHHVVSIVPIALVHALFWVSEVEQDLEALQDKLHRKEVEYKKVLTEIAEVEDTRTRQT